MSAISEPLALGGHSAPKNNLPTHVVGVALTSLPVESKWVAASAERPLSSPSPSTVDVSHDPTCATSPARSDDSAHSGALQTTLASDELATPAPSSSGKRGAETMLPLAVVCSENVEQQQGTIKRAKREVAESDKADKDQVNIDHDDVKTEDNSGAENSNKSASNTSSSSATDPAVAATAGTLPGAATASTTASATQANNKNTQANNNRRKSVRWSKHEDEMLKRVVSRYSDAGKQVGWKQIAAEFHELCATGRTDVQCLHRWNKSLKPGLVKGPWTSEEDSIIRSSIMSHGYHQAGGIVRWSSIAKLLKGRLGKQVRERWINHLDPSISKSEWTPEEDERLFLLREEHGNRWKLLAKMLPGRSENGVKNRWHSLQPNLEEHKLLWKEHERKAGVKETNTNTLTLAAGAAADSTTALASHQSAAAAAIAANARLLQAHHHHHHTQVSQGFASAAAGGATGATTPATTGHGGGLANLHANATLAHSLTSMGVGGAAPVVHGAQSLSAKSLAESVPGYGGLGNLHANTPSPPVPQPGGLHGVGVGGVMPQHLQHQFAMPQHHQYQHHHHHHHHHPQHQQQQHQLQQQHLQQQQRQQYLMFVQQQQQQQRSLGHPPNHFSQSWHPQHPTQPQPHASNLLPQHQQQQQHFAHAAASGGGTDLSSMVSGPMSSTPAVSWGGGVKHHHHHAPSPILPPTVPFASSQPMAMTAGTISAPMSAPQLMHHTTSLPADMPLLHRGILGAPGPILPPAPVAQPPSSAAARLPQHQHHHLGHGATAMQQQQQQHRTTTPVPVQTLLGPTPSPAAPNHSFPLYHPSSSTTPSSVAQLLGSLSATAAATAATATAAAAVPGGVGGVPHHRPHPPVTLSATPPAASVSAAATMMMPSVVNHSMNTLLGSQSNTGCYNNYPRSLASLLTLTPAAAAAAAVSSAIPSNPLCAVSSSSSVVVPTTSAPILSLDNAKSIHHHHHPTALQLQQHQPSPPLPHH